MSLPEIHDYSKFPLLSDCRRVPTNASGGSTFAKTQTLVDGIARQRDNRDKAYVYVLGLTDFNLFALRPEEQVMECPGPNGVLTTAAELLLTGTLLVGEEKISSPVIRVTRDDARWLLTSNADRAKDLAQFGRLITPVLQTWTKAKNITCDVSAAERVASRFCQRKNVYSGVFGDTGHPEEKDGSQQVGEEDVHTDDNGSGQTTAITERLPAEQAKPQPTESSTTPANSVHAHDSITSGGGMEEMDSEEGRKPITASGATKDAVLDSITGLDDEEKANALGNRLFQEISVTHPDLAGKITGMYIENPHDPVIVDMIVDDKVRRTQIDTAISVIQRSNKQNAMEAPRPPDASSLQDGDGQQVSHPPPTGAEFYSIPKHADAEFPKVPPGALHRLRYNARLSGEELSPENVDDWIQKDTYLYRTTEGHLLDDGNGTGPLLDSIINKVNALSAVTSDQPKDVPLTVSPTVESSVSTLSDKLSVLTRELESFVSSVSEIKSELVAMRADQDRLLTKFDILSTQTISCLSTYGQGVESMSNLEEYLAFFMLSIKTELLRLSVKTEKIYSASVSTAGTSLAEVAQELEEKSDAEVDEIHDILGNENDGAPLSPRSQKDVANCLNSETVLKTLKYVLEVHQEHEASLRDDEETHPRLQGLSMSALLTAAKAKVEEETGRWDTIREETNDDQLASEGDGIRPSGNLKPPLIYPRTVDVLARIEKYPRSELPALYQMLPEAHVKGPHLFIHTDANQRDPFVIGVVAGDRKVSLGQMLISIRVKKGNVQDYVFSGISASADGFLLHSVGEDYCVWASPIVHQLCRDTGVISSETSFTRRPQTQGPTAHGKADEQISSPPKSTQNDDWSTGSVPETQLSTPPA